MTTPKMVPVPSKNIVPERDVDKPPVLECINLGITFGGLKAVEDFNLGIGQTEIAGLIGPNGAGKTTIFNLLTKVYQPTTRFHPAQRPGHPEHGYCSRQPFRHRPYLPEHPPVLQPDRGGKREGSDEQPDALQYGQQSLLACPATGGRRRTAHEKALELLSIFNMAERGRRQGRLRCPMAHSAVWRSSERLATQPRLLLLDEPAAGMNPSETAELMENIRKIRDTFQIASHAHRA